MEHLAAFGYSENHVQMALKLLGQTVSSAIDLRVHHAMPGTGLAYCATTIGLRLRSAVPGTELARGASDYHAARGREGDGTAQQARYAISGADMVYSALALCLPCQLLRQHIVLPNIATPAMRNTQCRDRV